MVGAQCETCVIDEAIARPADDRVLACSNARERMWRVIRTPTAGITGDERDAKYQPAGLS